MPFRIATITAAGCAVAIVATLGATYGAFSATTSNGGNNFAAAASFGPELQMATGTYNGNDVDDRSITAGFQPDFVIVKDDNNQVAMGRTSTMPADLSKTLAGGNNLMAGAIKNFDANGFTVGTQTRVNQSGHAYYWVAFKAAAGILSVGTYTGNGTSQSITGLGFAPEYVATMDTQSQRAVQRFTGMTRTFQFDRDAGASGRINSLDADGFTVGSQDEANRNGDVYHYVAFNDVGASIKTGSYSGDGNDNRNIGGVGFQPDYLMVRANHTQATGKEGAHRPASLTGDNSLPFDGSSVTSNQIQAFQPDGFQLGTNPEVNDAGVTFHYIAFRNG